MGYFVATYDFYNTAIEPKAYDTCLSAQINSNVGKDCTIVLKMEKRKLVPKAMDFTLIQPIVENMLIIKSNK